MDKYTLVLANDIEIPDLTKNGTNYISEVAISEALFSEENLVYMVEKCSDGTETQLNNVEFIQQVTYDEGQTFYLAFREKTAEEVERERLNKMIKMLQEENSVLTNALLEIATIIG